MEQSDSFKHWKQGSIDLWSYGAVIISHKEEIDATTLIFSNPRIGHL